MEHLLKGRLAIGRERYGHGVQVDSDTRKWGTPTNSWIDMALEEFLDGIIYLVADYIRNGREGVSGLCELEKEWRHGCTTDDEDDNDLILFITKNYMRIESLKHRMLIGNLITSVHEI